MRNDFESNYLAHHGILGQKWGHKNGPPYPLDAGDHSSSEKKAGYKKSIGGGRNEELYNAKQKKKQQKHLAKTVKELHKKDATKIKDEVDKHLSDEQRKNLQVKYKKWHDAFDTEEKFFESKEYMQANQKAYDDTLSYYKKNEPEQLSVWIKNNGGKTSDLDAFHDFRKTFEGFNDEYTSKANAEYNKRHNIDKNAENKAWEEFQNYSKEVTESLVGKYGNQKLEKSEWMGRVNVDAAVRGAVEQLAYKKKK